CRTYMYEGEHACDENRDIFCESVVAVAKASGGEGFAAIKITALGRPALLLRLSESIAQTHNFFKALTGDSLGGLQMERISEDDFAQKLKVCENDNSRSTAKITLEWDRRLLQECSGRLPRLGSPARGQPEAGTDVEGAQYQDRQAGAAHPEPHAAGGTGVLQHDPAHGRGGRLRYREGHQADGGRGAVVLPAGHLENGRGPTLLSQRNVTATLQRVPGLPEERPRRHKMRHVE
ncbi:hypothetical protein PFISCL1PPCAC_17345, partial [Pristionchus fissidentatus]